jgi:uncharacterized protein (UPF0261 family)
MESIRKKYVIIIGTLDTKGVEVSYLRTQLQTSGLLTKVIDVGTSSAPACCADISREEVASKASADIRSILKQDDGKLKAMDAMARGALLLLEEKITSAETAGVVALGGGVGTWIGMQVMHALPFGFPKMMISTLPFDIRPYMGSKDIMIVSSVTDILGLNPILRKVLQNAAGAMAGMVGLDKLPQSSKKVIAITALGVTTPLVNGCKEILEAQGFEVAAFHGVGVGGKIFEDWVQTGFFSGVLDLTPHDINNFLFEGISPPYPGRLESAARKNIPQVVAPGGLDFISKGPIDTLTEEDRQKKHYQHSPMFTHVRVISAEMKEVAQVVADKLNIGQGSTIVAIPLRGFSYQGHTSGHLADSEADMTFVRVLKQKLQKDIPVIEVDAHINDQSFAETVCSLLFELIESKQKSFQ